jgi:hypothetical protein
LSHTRDHFFAEVAKPNPFLLLFFISIHGFISLFDKLVNISTVDGIERDPDNFRPAFIEYGFTRLDVLLPGPHFVFFRQPVCYL